MLSPKFVREGYLQRHSNMQELAKASEGSGVGGGGGGGGLDYHLQSTVVLATTEA